MPPRRLLGLPAVLLLLALPPVETQPPATVVGGTPRQAARVDDALARFEMADLPLPPVVVEFHDGYAACSGKRGLHHLVPGGGSRIDVCAPHPDHPDQRSTLVHELAHAWAADALTQDDRDSFRLHRGLETWNGQDTEWQDRATEHAAEVITWALVRHPVLFVRIPDKSCTKLAVAYEVLTGRLPERPGRCPVF